MSFEQFWANFPRHEHRRDAEKAYAKLPPDVTVEMLIESVDGHVRTIWRGRAKQFIPLAGTYLRGRLWEDELPPEKEKNPREMWNGWRNPAEIW